MEEDVDEFLMDMTAVEQRRVIALREVQEKYDKLNKEYQRERAKLEAQYMEKYNPIFDERTGIVSGKTVRC